MRTLPPTPFPSCSRQFKRQSTQAVGARNILSLPPASQIPASLPRTNLPRRRRHLSPRYHTLVARRRRLLELADKVGAVLEAQHELRQEEQAAAGGGGEADGAPETEMDGVSTDDARKLEASVSEVALNDFTEYLHASFGDAIAAVAEAEEAGASGSSAAPKRRALRTDFYSVCRRLGVHRMLPCFGLPTKYVPRGYSCHAGAVSHSYAVSHRAL